MIVRMYIYTFDRWKGTARTAITVGLYHADGIRFRVRLLRELLVRLDLHQALGFC